MPNNVNDVVSEGNNFTPSDTALINQLQTLSTNIQELTTQIQEREKKELEEEKKQKEEKEKNSNLELEQEKAYQKEKEDFLNQITTLVENSDQQETLTFQEQIIEKLEEITIQNQVNFIFMGVFIAFGCVSIFQKAFLKR